jgi:GTP-binding protein HflX
MRVNELGKEIKKLERSRRLHREARRQKAIPVVAVAGYTNAGKSTLMNTLTDAGALVADQVFATLDPTTRVADLPDGRKILLTDTVGFMQELPTELVAAFRATLDEVTEADVILHVLDISHPAAHDHFAATNAVLEELEALEKPLMLALNKCDLLDSGTLDGIVRRSSWTPYTEVVRVSALRRQGLDSLLHAIQRVTATELVRLELMIPYEHAGAVEAELRRKGRVLEEAALDTGIRVVAEVPQSATSRFSEYEVPAVRTA